MTRHQFYAYRIPKVIKDWSLDYAPVPDNYHLLRPVNINPYEQKIVPLEIYPDYDLVLSQNKAGQFQVAQKVAKQLDIPLISLEHTLPHPSWPPKQVEMICNMSGDFNVFLSEYSRKAWGWKGEAEIIHNSIDTNIFIPGHHQRGAVCLSVVNDWINRDWCCGYYFWKEATQNLPVRVLGNTPGLSKPASSIPELVSIYQQSQIFVNTSLVSTCPSTLLEAMACECCVVSTDTCMIPQIIKDGYNGFLASTPQKMRTVLNDLLRNPERCYKVGENARKTVLKDFSTETFVHKWSDLFKRAIGTP